MYTTFPSAYKSAATVNPSKLSRVLIISKCLQTLEKCSEMNHQIIEKHWWEQQNNWLFLSSSTFISNKFPTTRQVLIKIFVMQFVWFFSSVQDNWQRRKIETCQKYRTQRGCSWIENSAALERNNCVWLGTGAVILKHSRPLRCLKHTHTHTHIQLAGKNWSWFERVHCFVKFAQNMGRAYQKK